MIRYKYMVSYKLIIIAYARRGCVFLFLWLSLGSDYIRVQWPGFWEKGRCRLMLRYDNNLNSRRFETQS